MPGGHALADARFRRFFAGQAASVLGTWTFNSFVVLALVAAQRTGVETGLVVAAGVAPLVVGMPLGGTLADRIRGHVRALQFAYALGAAVCAALALALDRWPAHPVVMAAGAFGVGCVVAFEAPTRQVVVYRLVGIEGLASATAASSVAFNVARLAGPGLAAALLSAGHDAAPVWLNAASFVAALGSLQFIDRSRLLPVLELARTPWSSALRAMAAHAVIAPCLVAYALIGTLSLNDSVAVPLFSREVFGSGSAEAGGLLAAVALGALAGSAFLLWRPDVGHRRLAATSTALAAANLAVVPLSAYAAVAAGLAAVGACATLVSVGAQTRLQRDAPGEIRGRINAAFYVLTFGSYVLGAPLLGVTADAFGGRSTLVVAGVGALGGAAVLARARARRCADTPPASRDAAAVVTATEAS